MDWLTIGVIIGVVTLIIISIAVFFVIRTRFALGSVAEIQKKLLTKQEDFFRADAGQREKQIQKLPDKPTPDSRQARIQTFPEKRAILFFDFDHTISVQHMWDLTGGVNDPTLITEEKTIEVFQSQEYIERFKEFWKQLNNIPGLEIQIVSRSYESMIRTILQKIHLSPPPAKIAGRETLAQFDGRDKLLNQIARLPASEIPNEKALEKMDGKKALYVLSQLAKRNYNAVFFVDDTGDERFQMKILVPRAIICCNDLTAGLSVQNMDFILKKIKESLSL